MSRERAQAMASRQLASVGSETTAAMTYLSKNACFYFGTAQTFVVHFEWEVGLGFQRGKRLRLGFSNHGETGIRAVQSSWGLTWPHLGQ